MFIAMEISSNVEWMPFPFADLNAYLNEMLPSHRSCSHFKSLKRKVREQVDHMGTTSLAEGKLQSERLLAQRVSEESDTDSTSEPEQEPPLVHSEPEPLVHSEPEPLVHTPRHDAESVFWLLWYLLARANPQSGPPVEKDSVQKKDYDNFCSTMLNHTVGARTETRAPLAQMSIQQYRQTLHPCFVHLGDMLFYMGRYFLIDPKTWSDYDTDHAYYFMQCLLLREVLQNERPRKLLLDKAKPRPATEHMAQVRQFVLPLDVRSSHNYPASLAQYNAVSCSVSSLSLKRKSDTDPEGIPVSRRRRTVSTPPRRSRHISYHKSSHQDHAALAGAPQTGIQPEIVQLARNPFFTTPDRAEANEDGSATEDEDEGDLPDVEQANYVESQETRQDKERLEEKALAQWSKGTHSLVQAFNAANTIQESMLRGEKWFTVEPEWE